MAKHMSSLLSDFFDHNGCSSKKGCGNKKGNKACKKGCARKREYKNEEGGYGVPSG